MIENGYVKNEQGALVQVDGMSEESKRRKHKAVCLNWMSEANAGDDESLKVLADILYTIVDKQASWTQDHIRKIPLDTSTFTCLSNIFLLFWCFVTKMVRWLCWSNNTHTNMNFTGPIQWWKRAGRRKRSWACSKNNLSQTSLYISRRRALMAMEMKKPKNSGWGPYSDLVKLGKELKNMADALMEASVSHPKVCGLLDEGKQLTQCFQLDTSSSLDCTKASGARCFFWSWSARQYTWWRSWMRLGWSLTSETWFYFQASSAVLCNWRFAWQSPHSCCTKTRHCSIEDHHDNSNCAEERRF